MNEEEVMNKLKVIKVCGDKAELWNYEAGIILNLIEKQDKMIKTDEIMAKEDAKYIKELKEKIEKQDKMIDFMAEYLADIDFDECCAEIPEPCLGCSWEDYEPHTQCIKEYFREKVENEN